MLATFPVRHHQSGIIYRESQPKLPAWSESNLPEGFAVLIEISETWETGKAYLKLT